MNMVHPEDRSLDLFHSVFRLLGKDGYHYVSESVEKEGNSILHGHISDVTEFIREKEQNNILSALTMDYISLVLCDLKQDTVEVIKQDASCAEMNWHTYSESLNYFYDNVLMKDSCPNYMDLLSNASLMRTLKEQGSLEWHFQIVPDENGISNLGGRAVFLYEDLNHFKIIMGCRPIDEVIKRERVLELQRHQAERDERHAGHRRTDRQAQPPYRGLCVRQGSAVNERETRPFQAGFFLSGRPKILPNRA